MTSEPPSTIERTKLLHNLSTDECWKFYYDETNNFRKLKVRDTDFNKPFRLGGIVNEGNLDADLSLIHI